MYFFLQAQREPLFVVAPAMDRDMRAATRYARYHSWLAGINAQTPFDYADGLINSSPLDFSKAGTRQESQTLLNSAMTRGVPNLPIRDWPRVICQRPEYDAMGGLPVPPVVLAALVCELVPMAAVAMAAQRIYPWLRNEDLPRQLFCEHCDNWGGVASMRRDQPCGPFCATVVTLNWADNNYVFRYTSDYTAIDAAARFYRRPYPTPTSLVRCSAMLASGRIASNPTVWAPRLVAMLGRNWARRTGNSALLRVRAGYLGDILAAKLSRGVRTVPNGYSKTELTAVVQAFATTVAILHREPHIVDPVAQMAANLEAATAHIDEAVQTTNTTRKVGERPIRLRSQPEEVSVTKPLRWR